MVTIYRQYFGGAMRFYNRINELEVLERQYEQTSYCATMTVLTGRRRIGKTLLSLEYAKNKRYIYLFVSKKNEVLLCAEFIQSIENQFKLPIHGEIKDFKTVFSLLMEIGKKEKIVVIIDEFQEFYNINPSIYSEVQNIWDQNKNSSQVHLIFIGSIYSLMSKIFKNNKEPLFGRADRILYLKPFSPSTIKQILVDNNSYSKENLFRLYMITGGVPRYLDILQKNTSLGHMEILKFFYEQDSPFIEEGKTILIEEFGKDYGTYFSILELIAEGRTSRSEIESVLEKTIGGYLEKLENEYDIIQKVKPVGAKNTSRVQKYAIKDQFFNFWFRFVYKYRSAIENNNTDYINAELEKSLQTYSGAVLEDLYQEIYRESGKYSVIGNYWERGNYNEVDLVCINETEKEILIGEIKVNKISLENLKEKAHNLIQKYRGYTIKYIGLGIDDIDQYM